MATEGQEPAATVGETAAAHVRSAGAGFVPRSLDRAEKQAARVADRWAPESCDALRVPSLRSLSFVDHLLAPSRSLVSAAGPARAGRQAPPREAGAAWWLFPTPWYLDALETIQAEVQRATPRPSWQQQAARDADLAMGRVPIPPSAPAVTTMTAGPTSVPEVSRSVPGMPMVAGEVAPPSRPSVGQAAAAPAPASRVAPPSPASAPSPVEGERVAEAAPAVARGGEAETIAPMLPGLPPVEVAEPSVTAAEAVDEKEESAAASAFASSVPSVAAAMPPATPAAAFEPAAAVRAGAPVAPSRPAGISVAAPAAAPRGVPGPLALPVALAALRAWSPLVSAPAAHAAEQLLQRRSPSGRPSRETPDTSALIRALVAPDAPEAATSAPAWPVAAPSPAVARAAAAPAGVPAETPTPAEGVAPSSPLAAPEARVVGAAPAVPAAVDSSARAETVAAPAGAAPAIPAPAPVLAPPPAAGPRVLMPAGLSGLFAGLGAASLVEAAIERNAPAATAQRAQGTAEPGPLAAAAPRAASPGPLAHVAWADAWLARVAGAPEGASTPTVAAAQGLRARQAPAPPFVEPALSSGAPGTMASSAAALPGRVAAAMPMVAPAETPSVPTATAAPSPATRPAAAPTAGTPAPVARRAGEAPAMPVVEPPMPSESPSAPAMAASAAPAPGATAPPAPAATTSLAPTAVSPLASTAVSPLAPTTVPSLAPATVPPLAPATVPPLAREVASLALVGAPPLAMPSGLGASPAVASLAKAAPTPAEAPLPVGADMARAPLHHVSWADEWLARFVGAPAAPAASMPVAAQAPAPVLVSPSSPDAGEGEAPAVSGRAAPAAQLPALRLAGSMPVVEPVAPEAALPPAAAAPAPAPAAALAAAPAAAPAAAIPSPAPDAGMDVGLPTVGWAPPPPVGPAAPSFSAALPAALMASPLAPQLASLLGMAPSVLSGSGTLIERLRAAVAAPAAGAPRAPFAPAAPSFVYPQLATDEPTRAPGVAAPVRPSPFPSPVAPVQAAMETAPAPMRPGTIGARAEQFAAAERLRVSDLSLDFVSPEMVEAASQYGFGATEAVRAARLAEAGYPVLSALNAGANLALMQRGVGSAAAAPTPVPAGAPPSVPSAAFRAPEMQPLLPEVQPRGAFVIPKLARDTLARQQPEARWPAAQPMELAALDVMAASSVASDGKAGSDRLASARAAFEADYVSPAAPPSAGAVPPMVPAARALARASGHALERPVFNVDMPTAPMVAVDGAEIPVHEVASALRSWVAPVAPTSVAGGFVARPPIGGGTLPSLAPPPPEPIRSAPTPEAKPALGTADFPIPDWFEDAARKLLGGGDKSDDRFGIPELTLIQSAASSGQRIAAKGRGEPAAAPATPAEARSASKEGKKDDIEQLARDVLDEVRRLIEAAEHRSGKTCP